MARLKKLQDPEEYNRVVEQKMKRSKMTREEAEADYNQFLENPPFYYALEKKVRLLFLQFISHLIYISKTHANKIRIYSNKHRKNITNRWDTKIFSRE
jgi:hypothetical protein